MFGPVGINVWRTDTAHQDYDSGWLPIVPGGLRLTLRVTDAHLTGDADVGGGPYHGSGARFGIHTFVTNDTTTNPSYYAGDPQVANLSVTQQAPGPSGGAWSVISDVADTTGYGYLRIKADIFTSDRGTATCSLEVDGLNISICEYGTRLTDVGHFLVYLTPGLIDVALLRVGMSHLAPFFTAFWFTWTSAVDLCGSGPPSMPDISLGDWTAVLLRLPGAPYGKMAQLLNAILWPMLCECVPAPAGQPAPIAPPAPTIIRVDQLPSPPPSLLCDTGDLCGILTRLTQTVGALQSKVDSMTGLVTLIQRQHVPFAYIPGVSHAGLTGAGSLAVQGILGLSVTFTAVPSTLSSDMESPASSFFFGDLSLGTADGWDRRIRLTHNPHLVLDVSGAVTAVGYTFSPGVTATVLELKREA